MVAFPGALFVYDPQAGNKLMPRDTAKENEPAVKALREKMVAISDMGDW